jgi:hypothetical protein
VGRAALVAAAARRAELVAAVGAQVSLAVGALAGLARRWWWPSRVRLGAWRWYCRGLLSCGGGGCSWWKTGSEGQRRRRSSSMEEKRWSGFSDLQGRDLHYGGLRCGRRWLAGGCWSSKRTLPRLSAGEGFGFMWPLLW